MRPFVENGYYKKSGKRNRPEQGYIKTPTRMEAYIIKNINTLIRECELKCDFIQTGSHTIKFDYSNDYTSEGKIEDFILDKMNDVIYVLENDYGKHFEFSYEVDNEGSEWEITIEWILASTISNPFKLIRMSSFTL
jgi:hypothetical protein